jgi:phosphoenolpyruvate mutase
MVVFSVKYPSKGGIMSLKYRIAQAERLSALKRSIEQKGFVRIIEAHNGLSALIGEMAQIEQDGEIIQYDGFWESSLTDSASKGIPDAEIVGAESRAHTIDELLNVTSKPIIVDGDTGGSAAQFEYLVKRLERLGVSAVIIEDKVFPKRNSLDPTAKQTQEAPEKFAQKIKRGKDVTVTDDFMIIARIESLIAGVGLDDALKRAECYIQAGVDGIMIHSKKESPDDILAFAKAYGPLCEKLGRRPVLVSVPTTYNLITDRELAEHGFNIIIHANHLLRAAHKSMKEVAKTILVSDRGFEADPLCSSVPEIFSTVGFDVIKAKDREYSKAQRLSVIIPAAGKDPVFTKQPKSLIRVAGRPILSYQLENIRKTGLNQIVIVRGHEGEQFDKEFSDENLTFYDNAHYDDKHSLYSLFRAQDHMKDGFLLIYSDILFNHEHLQKLIDSDKDIVLLVDNSYRFHKHEIDKKLDLVISKRQRKSHYYRSLQPTGLVELTRIGKKINVDAADYEFIGMAYFSEEGARILRKVYQDCQETIEGEFHEAESFDLAGVTDLIQEVIDRGFTVHGLEVYKGWMEIHNPEDVKIAEQEVAPVVA